MKPNGDMRAAAAALFRRYPSLQMVDDSAEATTLPDRCADFVVAATVFHCFDGEACRAEFSRILTPQRYVVLIWNMRQSDLSVPRGL